MGRMTENDSRNLQQIGPWDRTEILYRYLVLGEDMKTVAREVYDDDGDFASQSISVVTRAFGFHNGRGRGRYRTVSRKAVAAFVETYSPEYCRGGLDEGTFDEFLREYMEEEETGASIPEPAVRVNPTRPTGVSTRPVCSAVRPSGGGYTSSGGGYAPAGASRSGGVKLGPIAAVVLVVVLLLGGSRLIQSGKLFVGKVDSFLSGEYQAEIFNYEGAQYLGNQRFNKPDGVCMRLDGSDCTLGYFEGGKLDGYGLVARSGITLEMGPFKKDQLHGWGIHRVDGVVYVAQFKKGAPTGYGYRYEGGTEQLVKFKSAQAGGLRYDNALKVVATRQGDAWYKENGKELKVTKDTYKGITYLGAGRIRVNDVEYSFDPAGEVFYDSEEIQLSWDTTDCMYDSILEDEEGTRLVYTFGQEIRGSHQYETKQGLVTKSFSAQVS